MPANKNTRRQYPKSLGRGRGRQREVTPQDYVPRNPRRPGRRKPLEARRAHETRTLGERGRADVSNSKPHDGQPGSSDPYRTIHREAGRKVKQMWVVFVDGKLQARRRREDALRLLDPKLTKRQSDRQLPKLVTL
jgi:hypothetical protein